MCLCLFAYCCPHFSVSVCICLYLCLFPFLYLQMVCSKSLEVDERRFRPAGDLTMESQRTPETCKRLKETQKGLQMTMLRVVVNDEAVVVVFCIF